MKKTLNEMDFHNKIVSLANSLKLSAFSDYKAYIQNGFSTEEILYNLLLSEHSIKEEGKYKYRMKNAAFPIIKTLDTFVFDQTRLPNLKKETVMELASCNFIREKKNVVAVGNSGTGKSHIATSIGIEAISKGYTVKFKRASDLVNQMTEAASEKHLSQFIKTVNACDCLIIDELGYLSFDVSGSSLLFQIFAARYETKSTIVTSNLEFSKWVTCLGNEEHMTSALIGRLIEESVILNMNGEDHRLHKKYKREV